MYLVNILDCSKISPNNNQHQHVYYPEYSIKLKVQNAQTPKLVHVRQ